MEQSRAQRNYEEPLSPESIFVAFVFFMVLSQVSISASDAITQPLRPLIVLILTVQAVRRGRLNLPVCTVALVMSVYQLLVWFFLYPDGGGLKDYLVLVFYYMMLFCVAGFPWNRRELQFILYITFLATFACAVIFAFSNNPTDFSVHDIKFMGEVVNRNKNAYAFGFGIVLGSSFLLYGRGRNRILIFLMMLLECYCLLYSQCRGAFIGVVLSLGAVTIHRILQTFRNNNPYAMLYVLLFILILTAVFFLIKYSAWNRLLDSEDYSGRDDGIKHAVDMFFKASLPGKIFGNGFLYETQGTQKVGAHFVYLTYLLQSGVIGAVLIIIIFMTAAVRVRGEIQWSLFLIALSRTVFEGMDYYIFIPLILTVCISNYSRMHGGRSEDLFWIPHYEAPRNRYRQTS